MTPRAQTIVTRLAVALGVVALGFVFCIFVAPLCMTTGCTPQQRAADVAIISRDLAPAEACAVREVALGELVDPLAIVGACVGLTLEGLAQITASLLADEFDGGAAGPLLPAVVTVAHDEGGGSTIAARLPAVTPARARCRKIHAAARALLADATAPAG